VAPPEVDFRRGSCNATFDPFQRQEGRRIVGDGEHLWDVHRERLGQPRQAGRLGREETRRRPAVRLHEHPPSVGQIDRERDRHVAATHRR
jgi:hypothetical protein